MIQVSGNLVALLLFAGFLCAAKAATTVAYYRDLEARRSRRIDESSGSTTSSEREKTHARHCVSVDHASVLRYRGTIRSRAGKAPWRHF